jgi:hypothetical protein
MTSLDAFRIGEIFKNKLGYEAEIIGVSDSIKGKSKKYVVKFLETGYTFESEYGNLKKGNFKDYYRPSVYGVGISKTGAKKSPLYKTWSHMLERCYSQKCDAFKYYGGKGVRVCDEWLIFTNFEKDAKELVNYDKFLESIKVGTRNYYSLDKDILGNGMIYSKSSCMFANQYEQMQAQDRVKRVKCISPDGTEIIYNSKHVACKATGVQNANLYKVLSGERKHSLGYKFIELE